MGGGGSEVWGRRALMCTATPLACVNLHGCQPGESWLIEGPAPTRSPVNMWLGQTYPSNHASHNSSLLRECPSELPLRVRGRTQVPSDHPNPRRQELGLWVSTRGKLESQISLKFGDQNPLEWIASAMRLSMEAQLSH